jgi:CBS-domain-containing membrane protein
MEMSCLSLLSPDQPTLRPEQTVADAVRLLLQLRVLALPVVDGGQRYRGMFAKSHVFKLALPSIATITRGPHGYHPMDLSFLPDSLDDMRDRLRAVAGQPVVEFADANVPFLAPDMPVSEAVLLLHRERNFLPVVDPQTREFFGVVSTWDVIARLAEGL